jgi:hypothetical protein
MTCCFPSKLVFKDTPIKIKRAWRLPRPLLGPLQIEEYIHTLYTPSHTGNVHPIVNTREKRDLERNC